MKPVLSRNDAPAAAAAVATVAVAAAAEVENLAGNTF
jgi:hypothetical protein